jgi:hypothetical protein
MKPPHTSANILIALALTLAACAKPAAPPVEKSGPMKLLTPPQGAYTGAYIDFGETEDDVSLEAIEKFEKLVGKKQSIIASSSYWGEQTFPSENVALIFRHGAIPLVFWSPWDRPYTEFNYDGTNDPVKYAQNNKFALAEIIAGKWDAYIDRWGDGAHAYGQPMLVSLCNEMNGTWFPWSGYFNGSSKVIPGTAPLQYEGAETFKKAYRHIVDRVRARGATNIQWVFHLMNLSIPLDRWNMFAQYYPGRDYVDWLGLSVYGKQTNDDNWAPFNLLFEWPYQELAALDPDKPIMLAEWGIGEFPKAGSKPDWITGAFAEMRNTAKYPRVKAAVFWHERWENDDGSYSNLRVNSTPEALTAYRKGVADPFWISQPRLVPVAPTPTKPVHQGK